MVLYNNTKANSATAAATSTDSDDDDDGVLYGDTLLSLCRLVKMLLSCTTILKRQFAIQNTLYKTYKNPRKIRLRYVI